VDADIGLVRVKGNMFSKSVLFIMLVSLFAIEVSADSSRLYRYKDLDGRVVLNGHLPPDVISRGYSILNSHGQVIQVVPRSLTAEELEARDGSKEERAARAQTASRQNRADQRLLTIFSAPEDAERARERKIEALDVIISINKGNIARLLAEFDTAQGKAAAQERSGQAVTSYLLEEIGRFERQINELEDTNAEKEKEKLIVRESYAKDIARLKLLIGERQR